MASPLSLLIGLRFSRGRRRGGMVSLISVISTIGIALGVAVLIVGLSAMNGFERELNNRILAVVPHGKSSRLTSRGRTGAMRWQSGKSAGHCAAAPYITLPGWWRAG
jgi:lipoprotein-releasing system permease protein